MAFFDHRKMAMLACAIIMSVLSFNSMDALQRSEGCNECIAPKQIKLRGSELTGFEKEASSSSSHHKKNKCHQHKHRHRECDRVHVISRVPYTITRSGKYCVKRDLTYTGSGSAIIVEADNVTINFANHSLFLTDPSATGVFAADVEEFTLLNDKISLQAISGNISSNAIHLLRVTKARIDNIFTENTNVGLRVEDSNDILDINAHHKNHVGSLSSAGVRVSASANVKVDNSVFEGNSGDAQFGSPGVWLENDTANSVVVNSEFSNIDIGLFVPRAHGILFENLEINSFAGAAFNGIQIGANTTANELVHDIILRNVTVINRTAIPAFDGVSLNSGSGILIENLIVDTNTSFDEGLGYTPAALHIGCAANGGCDPETRFVDAIIRNTIITNNNDVGLYIEFGENIVFEDGEITGSNEQNVLFDTAFASTIKNSFIGNAGGDGIVIREGSNDNSILNNTVTENENGIFVDTSAFRNHLQGNNVYANRHDGINNQGSNTETYFNTSCNNNLNNDGGLNCNNVFPAQDPGDPAVAGSNICCPQRD